MGVKQTGGFHNVKLHLLTVNLLIWCDTQPWTFCHRILKISQVYVWRLNVLITDKCIGGYPICRNHPSSVWPSDTLPNVGTLAGCSILLVHLYLPPSMGTCFWPLSGSRYWASQTFWYGPFQVASHIVIGKLNHKKWSLVLLLSAGSYLWVQTPDKTQWERDLESIAMEWKRRKCS